MGRRIIPEMIKRDVAIFRQTPRITTCAAKAHNFDKYYMATHGFLTITGFPTVEDASGSGWSETLLRRKRGTHMEA